MAQKPVLGKGLASLFPGMAQAGSPAQTHGSAEAAANPSHSPTGATSAGNPVPVTQADVSNKDRIPGVAMANIDDLQINQYQPRRDFDQNALEELAQSIRANGIIQPLVVRKTAAGHYELIAGERRLRASKLAGLRQVPVVIRKSTDRESLELALIENIQRQNLNCIDEALAYFQLVQDFSLTQEEVAIRVGKDRATVANHLRLLRLPAEIIEDLKKHKLTFGHGKSLLALDDNELRLKARTEVLEKHLSVRDTEALVDSLKNAVAAQTPDKKPGDAIQQASPIHQRMLQLAQNLTRHWSTRVEIKGSERRGKIVFHYANRQDLDRLLDAMQNHKV